MNKKIVRVIIGRQVQLTAPGMLGRKFEFRPGHTFLCQEWFYPGEPYEKGDLVGTSRDQWSFGANTTSDLPLTFSAEDVKEVVILDDAETVRVFNKAPFIVTIMEPCPCTDSL